MFRNWRATKGALALVSAALFLSSSALAQVNPPSWWGTNNPDASEFGYSFDQLFWPPVPDLANHNTFGDPDYDQTNLWYTTLFSGRGGVWGAPPGVEAEWGIRFRNAHRPTWIKHVWFQVDHHQGTSGSDVWVELDTEAGSTIENLNEDVAALGGDWYRSTITFTIRPQPEWESVRFFFHGGSGANIEDGAWIDNFYFGTICIVPEPGTVAAMGLGAALLLVRRRRK